MEINNSQLSFRRRHMMMMIVDDDLLMMIIMIGDYNCLDYAEILY